jgi:hypothetical protein
MAPLPNCSLCFSFVRDRVRKAKKAEAGFLVRVHPDQCLILIRAQIRALMCASK